MSSVQGTGPITQESNEDQVKTWLIETCGLSEDELELFEFMDGATLFEFKDHQQLNEAAGVGYGLACRIIFLRDYPESDSAMLKWTTGDVIEFIQQSLKSKIKLERFQENGVDGIVLFAFHDAKEMELELGLKGMLARRILVERNKFLSEEKSLFHDTDKPIQKENNSQLQTSNDSTKSFESTFSRVPSETSKNDQGRAQCANGAFARCSDVLQQEEERFSQKIPDTASEAGCHDSKYFVHELAEGDAYAFYKMFLQDYLHLQPMNVTGNKNSFVNADLKVIYHKRKNLNQLEECFLFLILCKTDFCSTRASKIDYSRLWKLITEQVNTLWYDELPSEIKNKFRLDKEKLFYDGHCLSYEQEQAKVIALPEYDKTVRKLLRFHSRVLLIDRRLFHEQCSGYSVGLGSRKCPVPYCFGFRKSKNYWLFDSDDFDFGFQLMHIPVKKSGQLQRCRFQWKNRDYSPPPKMNAPDKSCKVNTALECFEEGDSNVTRLQDQSSGNKSTLTKEVPESTQKEHASHNNDPFVTVGAKMGSKKRQKQKEPVVEDCKPPQPPELEKSNTEFQVENLEIHKQITPRPFLQQSWKYDEGILRVIETGDGMLTPSTEFKFQCGCAAEHDLAKRSFLYKSLEFVCGCLNSRQNGIIYFGVAERDVKNELFEYGQIVGVKMDQVLISQYYDLFRAYLPQCFPEHPEVVKLCVTGPQFVHLRNSDPTRYVIEIDIRPGSKQCRDIMFVFNPRCIFDKYGESEKKHVYTHNKKDWTGVFRRDGSETKYVGTRDMMEFKLQTFPNIIKEREDEEFLVESSNNRLMSSPEAEKLKIFIGQCDTSMFPVLVLPKLSEEEKRRLEYFEFINHIRWSAILDFDNDSDRDGVFSMSNSNNKAFEVIETVVHEFGDMSVEDRKDKLCFPKKAAWLFANGKSTGTNHFERLEGKAWQNSYWTYIQNAISFYKDNSVIPPTRRLVLILVSDEVGGGILEASQDIKTAFNWNNVFFVFNTECTRKYFSEELSDDVYRHSVVMPWQDAHYVVCECLNVKGQDRDKYVCTASGAHVPIPRNEWQTWTDLEVLSTKECEEEWEGIPKEQRKLKSQNEEINFHQGKPVSWWNFFCTNYAFNHVMKRSIKSKLLIHIDSKIMNVGSEVEKVPIIPIAHMPGAGGTTLGRDILWELKARYKCAVIKRISVDTERQICQFWESAEEGHHGHNQLQPVILLADNLTCDSSPFDELELCRKLYRRQKEFHFARPLAILLYLHRDVKPEGDFQVTQKLTDEEKAWMERKHEDLENQNLQDGVETFIAFLSLRHEFDREFLQKTIVQFIDHDSLERKERVLVEYIALITFYFPSSEGFPALPVTSCDELMRSYQKDMERSLPWEKCLSKVAQILLVVEYRYETEAPRNVVRIANQPYAKVILDTALKRNNETLGNIVIRCLDSVLVRNQSLSSKIVVHIFSKMLLERQVKEETARLTHLSPLVTEIIETNFEEAVQVLQVGYNRLKSEAFYQQLARLYMTADKFSEAKEFAQLAVQLAPTKRDFKHTLGLVHLKIFGSLKVRFSEEKLSENMDHLRVAFDALKNFFEAQGRGDDDALSICYAHCETIEVINKILLFIEKYLPQRLFHRFGCYMTEDNFNLSLFDDKPDFRATIKSLIYHSVKTLRFLYFLGFSHKSPKSGVSFKLIKDRRIVRHVEDTCITQFKTLARLLNTFHKRVRPSLLGNVNDARTNNAYRLENIKLKGCFFETIVKLLKVDQVQAVDTLKSIKHNLDQIDDMTYIDMDNFMTVCLSLEITGQEHAFSKNQSQIYKMCCEIIHTKEDVDDCCHMRAHLYRVLVSWPVERREGFNSEHFVRSFQHKPTFLMNRKEPIPPLVHFFVARSDQPFYLCHCSGIFSDNENEDRFATEMHKRLERHKRLETFVGQYKLVRKANGDHQYSCVEMQWECAEGALLLKIWKIRGLPVFRNERVEFFLGFSLHGPVAYIHRVLSQADDETDEQQ